MRKVSINLGMRNNGREALLLRAVMENIMQDSVLV